MYRIPGLKIPVLVENIKPPPALFVKFHEKDKLHGIMTSDREGDAVTEGGNNRKGSAEPGHRYARMSICHRQLGQKGDQAESSSLRPINQQGFNLTQVTLFVKGFLRGRLR